MQYFDYIFAVIAAISVVFASLNLVHMLQLESYQGKMYLKWVIKHIKAEFIPYISVGLAAVLFRIGWALFDTQIAAVAVICRIAADIVYVLMLFAVYAAYKRRTAKKPLVITGRIKRLIIALFIVSFLFSINFFMPYNYTSGSGIVWSKFILSDFVRYAPGMFLSLTVFLAYLITYPIEASVKRWYYNDAKKILKNRTDLKKIGITGSYGKTSTKFALGTLLSERFNVLFTPGSVNTPMGVTRIVRENLKPENDIFISEMGARYKGDIKELCDLVGPDIGIITSVGKQHLETFGSIEGVISTKAELMHGLKEDGICFFNGDYEYCRHMYEDCTLKEKYLFGTEGNNLYMRADNIKVNGDGSTFTLTAYDGNSIVCTTALLGRPSIWNILAAASCAYRLGMTLSEIAVGISKMESVEHRLQLIKGPITVIDDAFNSNPIGSKEALMVLKAFEGKRIIVTPGMVELGKEEDQLNYEFGRTMAHSTDIAILVGKSHIEPIYNGLIDEGFNKKNIVKVTSLSEATALLPLYTENGCVVLFENDLTDNYEE